MKKYAGNSMAQYGIIIAVVGLALVPVFYTFGGIIVDCLESFSKGLATNYSGNPTPNTNPETTPDPQPEPTAPPLLVEFPPYDGTPGPMGGTPTKPVKLCQNKECTIDFGEYILKGIPENLDEIAKSTGASGGTEELIALLEQIAQQLEDKGDVAGAADLRRLANIGHYMAGVEKATEEAATACASSATKKDLANCFAIQSMNVKTPIPDYVNDLVKTADQPSLVSSLYTCWGIYPGAAAEHLIDFPVDIPKSGEPQQSPAYAFLGIYNDIKNNDKYSDNTKAIVETLSVGINDLAYKIYATTEILDQIQWGDCTVKQCNAKTIDKYDFRTGELDNDNSITGSVVSVDYILHPPASTGTNFNSALICATGGTPDDGTKCN